MEQKLTMMELTKEEREAILEMREKAREKERFDNIVQAFQIIQRGCDLLYENNGSILVKSGKFEGKASSYLPFGDNFIINLE